jgi:3'-5' exonuclease
MGCGPYVLQPLTHIPIFFFFFFAPSITITSCLQSVLAKHDKVGQRRGSDFLGPAVVQLATIESVMVVHLTCPTRRRIIRSSLVPQLLVDKVLLDPSIVKVGCGIDMDMVELRAIAHSVEARSRLDLGWTCATSRQTTPGLKTLAEEILGLDLPKSVHVATSDWTQFPLSVEQISYAAYDAWAGVAIAHRLATLHPETLGATVLRDSLHDQVSIHELHSRKIVRERARSILTAVLEPHRRALSQSRKQKKQQQTTTVDDDSAVAAAELPRWKSRLVKELNVVLRANRHEVHNNNNINGNNSNNSNTIRGPPFADTFLRDVQNQTVTF